MTAVDSGTFSKWMRDWKELLKKPKEVALSAEYLPNLLPVAIHGLERWTRSGRAAEELTAETDHEAGLAVRLLRYALAYDPAVGLLELESPDEVRQLKFLLAEDAVDAHRLHEVLQALPAALSGDAVRRAVKAQLALGGDANSVILWGAAEVLACRSVGRFPKSQLQRLLGRSFAEAVASALLDENADRISRHAEVSARVVAVKERVIREAATQTDLRKTADVEDADLFELFGDDAWWRRAMYRLVAHLRRLMTDALREIEESSGENMPTLSELVCRLGKDHRVQCEMAREIVESYTTSVLRRQIRPVVRDGDRSPSLTLGEIAKSLELRLVELGISNLPSSFDEGPERFPPTRTRSAEALATALPIALSEVCAESYVAANTELVSQTAARLGERLVELLATEPQLSESTDKDMLDAETLCATWSSRRSLHREVGKILAELNPSIMEHLRHLSQDSHSCNASAGGRFWPLWRKYYSGEALHSFSLSIPWDAVQPSMLDGIVNKAISRLVRAQSEYLVVFRVGNLNAEGLDWQMGQVVFYDPAHFDHGEGSYFPAPAEDDVRAVSHAAVRVRADTSSAAKRLAHQRLLECLNCLSFGLSGNSLRPGFNPKVGDGEYIANLSGEISGFNYERTLDTHDEQRAEASNLPAMARAYGYLLRKSSDDPNGLTPLQEQFIRSVHWLREARWELDPAKRFVLHYVGLEHIFARGQGGKRAAIQKRAPRLRKTWRNIGTPLVWLKMGFREVHRMVENDETLRTIADGQDRLCGWRTDERVFLNPSKVQLMLDLIPESNGHVQSAFSRHLNELEKFIPASESISEMVERLRDYQLFKVGRLADLRNDVVHEALYQDERMVFYAQEALEILDDALDKMVGDATSTDPECKDIDELITRYDAQPWSDHTG